MSSTPPIFPPSWLDPKTEITKDKLNPPGWDKLTKKEKTIKGILISYKAIMTSFIELPNHQILEIIANSAVETGWFGNIPASNFGGVKVKELETKRITALTGICPPWWQKEGHIASGDQPMCYYRAYLNPEQFYKEWVTKYVPKPEVTSLTDRYRKCGEAFWKRQEWFPALIEAGYKGEVTKQNPNSSIEAHRAITLKLIKIISQKLLGLDPDGIWGNGSEKSLKNFQKENSIPQDGILTESIFDLLVSKWISSGCKI